MSATPILQVNNLAVLADNKQILKGVSFSLLPGEVHALMGPNGSGKSSLAMTLLGHPHYTISNSAASIRLDNTELLDFTPDERARAGIFVAWQSPLTIPGVSVFTLCRTAYEAMGKKIDSIVNFRARVEELLNRVGLAAEYLGRGVNEGFSGGEKKRLELLQLLLLQPKVVILDEIDSGLDIDALKLVGEVVRELTQKGTAVLCITHYKRLLEFVIPQTVSILRDGVIARSGGYELVQEIEEKGYRS